MSQFNHSLAVQQDYSKILIDSTPEVSSLSSDVLISSLLTSELLFEQLPLAATELSTISPGYKAPEITSRGLALKYCRYGDKSLAEQEYEQAKSAYEIALKWDSQLAIAYSGLAHTYHHLQDDEGALQIWNQAIEVDSTQLDFYYQRVLIHKLLKNYEQVWVDCRRILEKSPHHPSARWLNAVALVKLEKYQVAIFSLNQHIDAYPNDANGYCYRGICYERLDKFPQALADFDRSIALDSSQPVVYHARGRARQRLGDFQSTLADFDLAIASSPAETIEQKLRLAAVYDDRAEVHRCRGDYLEALADGDRAIELNPIFSDAYFRRGLTYAELGDLELAMLDYTTTIDINPQHVNAYIQRSWIYFREKKYQLAQADCQTVQIFDQSCFWSNYMSGVINGLVGLKQAAIANFSKAIEISPNYVSARYHRGILYYELGNIFQAITDFDQARSIQEQGLERLIDRDETGFYAEGLALYYLDQHEAARTVLTLGALSATRFNNPSFHQLILFHLDALGLNSEELT